MSNFTNMASLPEDEESSPLELERGLRAMRQRIRLIAACCIGIAALAFGFSSLQTEQYSTSASLLFRDPGFAEDLFGASAAPADSNAERTAATNEKLVELSVIGERAAHHLSGLSPSDVSGMITVTSEGQADVVSVTATSSEPRQASRVANTFARQFIQFRAETDRAKLLQAKRLAEREFSQLTPDQQLGVRGQALSRGAEKLGILASLQTGNAELVQPADLPASPSSPKPTRNAIIGAILGLLLGIGLAFLLERLNRRLRDPEEAQEAFGLPMLGTIPESKAIEASNQGAAVEQLPFVENEAFRMMRASLRYFNVDHELRRVLITSDAAQAGKSTVAWQMARVAASSSRVVLIESDLRNPSLSRQHEISVGPGLAELLTHQVSLEQAIQTKRITGGTNGADGGERALDVIVAGSLPPNPAELLESQAMADVLTKLGERYDLVIIDTPPTAIVSDAFPLLSKVDGVILVARIGVTTRDAAMALREQLDRLGAPLLGVVANGVKVSRRQKYGGYGYYGPGPEEKAGVEAKSGQV